MDHPTPTSERDPDRPGPILAALALAPVAAHLAGLFHSLSRSQWVLNFGRADYAVLLAVCLYLALVAWAFRSRRGAARLALATWAAAVPLAFGELALRPPRATPSLVPYLPGRKVARAADTMPGNTGEIRFTANRLGLRGPEVDLDRVDLRVLCVGGSTTECQHVSDERTWPWRLSELLAERLGKRIFVGNAGKPGEFTANHEYLLRQYPLAPRFDWVVLLAGINDAGRLYRKDRAWRMARLAERLHVVRDETAHRAWYRRTTLWRTAARALSRPAPSEQATDLEGSWFAQAREKRRRLLAANPLRAVPTELPSELALYRAALERIVELVRSRGQRMLLLTQPTLYRRDLPPALEALIWEHTEDGAYTVEVLETVMAAYNQVTLEVSRAQGVPCVDLAATIPKDTTALYDDCHFNIAGCEKVAGILADYFTKGLQAGGVPAVPRPRTFGRIERADPRLDRLLPRDAAIEVLADGFAWAEGPVWVPARGGLLFSDIPRHRVHLWRPGAGLSVFLEPSGGANGLATDPQGRLVLCQHGDRRVARLDAPGRLATLADRWQGRRLNSPNDLAWHTSGALYFTDPPYGLARGERDPARELDFQGVFRLSPSGELALLVRDLSRPNGIAFSPDEKTLYVANSDPARAVVMAYPVLLDGTLGPGRTFADWTRGAGGRRGVPDGLKVDRDGNLWATGPGGVLILAPDGTHLGTIYLDGKPAANCAWGEDGGTLFITAKDLLLRVRTSMKRQS